MSINPRLRSAGRVVVVVVVLSSALGTSCTASRAIALAPSPAAPTDSIARSSFALVSRLAARRGLVSSGGQSWPQCFSRQSLQLCGKVKDGEVQLRMMQAMTPRLRPWADSLRQDLLDSLRVEVGAGGVRECRWLLERDDAESGCPTVSEKQRP